MLQYYQTLSWILTHGSRKHSGFDFNEARAKSLSGIVAKGFNLAEYNLSNSIQPKTLSHNGVIKNIIAQLAFIKSGSRQSAQHINVPALSLSYIRIPKAASTSLSAMMLSEAFPTLKNIELNSEEVNYLTDVSLSNEINREHLYFTVVRNPFARIVSVYRDFFENAGKHFLYEDYLSGILKKDLKFKEFIKKISSIPNAWKDQHFKPQQNLLQYYLKHQIPLRILKLEQRADLQHFLSEYGLSLPNLNASHERYDYKTYFDIESLQLVKQIYKKDFELLGYDDKLILNN